MYIPLAWAGASHTVRLAQWSYYIPLPALTGPVVIVVVVSSLFMPIISPDELAHRVVLYPQKIRQRVCRRAVLRYKNGLNYLDLPYLI